ncbi:GNAT family N-acetyltransferase [Vibrio hepatarius]|uniref:GNAT family N-acetyltransferase n=1 Tax=Vibrio hepatarius TaxID=171383 RepID=UPI001C09AA23|nr:GNAT family N-acetyltransferase [Vibrio hepatarius]MBU2896896.1 GNAT family N-acetyltransferase [Vibrio hepatarius]
MSPLHIEVLDPMKLPIVARLYKAYYPSGKAKKDELILVGYFENQLTSAVRLRSVEQYRLLTGMMVIPEYREKGFGHQMMNYCEERVLTNQDFCFAYQHLESFYGQHGFQALEPQQLPSLLNNLFKRYSLTKKLVPMQYLPHLSN